MDKKETNRFLMYRAVLAATDIYKDIITANKALTAKVSKFKTTVDTIEALDHAYKNISKGTTSTKQALKDSVASFTDGYCGVLHNVGEDSGDRQLVAVTATNLSSLLAMRDSNLLAKAKDVAEMLTTNQAILVDYEITAEEITQYQTLIKNYDDSLNNKEVKIDMATTSRESLSEAFATANRILQLQLDKMMKIMELKQPAFYALYSKAREISDLGVRHIDAEIIVPEPATEPAK